MSWLSNESLRHMQAHFRARPWLWGALILGGLGLSGAALALSAPPDRPNGETFSAASLTLSVIVKLGVILLLIYVCLHLLRRLQSISRLSPNRRITILETAHLSPRQKLHLVQVGGRTLLLGATEQNLSFLAEVELPCTLEGQAQTSPSSPASAQRPTTPFADLLAVWLRKD